MYNLIIQRLFCANPFSGCQVMRGNMVPIGYYFRMFTCTINVFVSQIGKEQNKHVCCC